MVLLLVFMQLMRDLFAIAKFLLSLWYMRLQSATSLCINFSKSLDYRFEPGMVCI